MQWVNEQCPGKILETKSKSSTQSRHYKSKELYISTCISMFLIKISILKLKKQTKSKIGMINVKNRVPQLIFRCFQQRYQHVKIPIPQLSNSQEIILARNIRAKTYLRTTGDTPIEDLYCVTLPNMVPPKGPIIIHHILLVNEEITLLWKTKL